MNDQKNILSRAPFYRRSPFGMERTWMIAGQEVRATEENDVRMNFDIDEEGRARYPACPDCGAQDSIEDPYWDDDETSRGPRGLQVQRLRFVVCRLAPPPGHPDSQGGDQLRQRDGQPESATQRGADAGGDAPRENRRS